jgi:hypothetical protein
VEGVRKDMRRVEALSNSEALPCMSENRIL